MKLSHKCLVFLGLLIACCSSCKNGKGQSENENLSPLQEQQRVKADNEFSLALFKNLINQNMSGGNLIVSPLSVSFALGLASNGSADQTLGAFKNTLHFDSLTQAQVNSHYNNLITRLTRHDPDTKFDLANSIWYKQGFSVQPQFLETNSSSFHAKIQALDFSSPAAVKAINSWVSDQTKGNIPAIINEIPSSALIYMVNAIYFKSGWKEKFDVSETQEMPFVLANNSKVQASFMTGHFEYKCFKDNSVIVVELPYANDRFSMVIMMPVRGGRLSINDLDTKQWQGLIDHLQLCTEAIKIPKFKFSYSVELTNALTDLGLGAAFSDTANFSLINPDAKLRITQVLHKAYIETDESGSTAAAVTSVRGDGATAAPPRPPIVIDHPFMFVIREMSTGLIVFAGGVNNPLSAGE